MKNGFSSFGHLRPGLQGGEVKLQPGNMLQGNYTVQFGITDPNVALAIGNRVLLRAQIDWFVGGSSLRRIIDVGDGVSISGTADQVNVKVFDASTITSPAAVKDVDVFIQVAKGTRPAEERPPIYSMPSETLGPAVTSVVVPIPANIGAISSMVAVRPNTDGAAIGAYDIVVLQAANTAGSNILSGYDPRQTDWTPLVAGCKALVIRTSAAAPLLIATPIFGIDG